MTTRPSLRLPHSFEAASALLDKKSRLKIRGLVETALYRLDDDSIGLSYWNTVVVRFHRDGTVTLNSGGWRTVTTKARIAACGIDLSQRKFEWFIRQGNGEEIPFFDGIQLDRSHNRV